MGFTGSGTINFDDKFGTLEYAAQEILNVKDREVYSEVHDVKGIFADVKNVISDWGSSATRFYSASLNTQSKMMQDLSNISGTIAGLPSSISSSVETALIPVNKNVIKISDTLGKINTTLSNMSGANSAMPERDTLQDNIAPDYSGALNSISDLIGNIRDSINGIGSRSGNQDLYPDMHSDLESIKEAIGAMAESYSSSEGFDLDGFTEAVKSFVADLAEGVAKEISDNLLPGLLNEFSEFVASFTSSFTRSLSDNRKQLLDLLKREFSGSSLGHEDLREFSDNVDGVEGFQEKLIDIQSQFHADTIMWLENIDATLSKKFTALGNTVRDSAKYNTGRRDTTDDITSFEGDGNEKISTGKTVGGILSWLKESKIGDYLSTIVGMFMFANIEDQLSTLHKDTTMIIQATGLQRKDATALRSAISRNLKETYGAANVSAADRELYLTEAIKAGMVSQKHLEQATEVAAAYDKLLGTSLDFTQGWAKSLLVSKTDADEYLENVAVAIDDFSNKFFVSAERLQSAAADYAATAKIFSKDNKEFSKAINKAIGLVAAQENNAIQSMDLNEWLNRISTMSIADWSEADINRAHMLGYTNLYELSDRAFTDRDNLGREIAYKMDEIAEDAKRKIQAGGSVSDTEKYILSHVADLSAVQVASEAGQWKGMGDDITKEQQSGMLEASSTEDLAERQNQAANYNNYEKLENIAAYMATDDKGFLGKIYNWLENKGVSPKLAGILGGVVSGFVTKALTGAAKAVLRAVIGGGGFGGVIGAIKGFGGKILGGLGSIKGFIGKIGSKLFGGLKGLPGKLGEFGSKIKDFATNFGGKMPDFIKNSAKWLASPATSKIGQYTAEAATGGIGKKVAGKVVGTLGSKAAVGLSIFSALKDAGMGAHKSEEWVGGSDTNSKIAAGFGGLVGGTGSGVGGAIGNGLKWASIGTMIAPGIGTAIGGALGALTGAIGGERIAKGLKKASDFATGINDSVDIWLEENLGIVGKGLVVWKTALLSPLKNTVGGVFKGLGDIFGGFSDGFKQIMEGDFLGGLKTIFKGLLKGIYDLTIGMFVNTAKDIFDSIFKSSKDRAKKRKDEIKQASDEVTKATDEADKKIDAANKKDRLKHLDSPIFTKNAGRSGYAGAQVSGKLNRYAFSDASASAIAMNDQPLNRASVEDDLSSGKYWEPKVSEETKSLESTDKNFTEDFINKNRAELAADIDKRLSALSDISASDAEALNMSDMSRINSLGINGMPGSPLADTAKYVGVTDEKRKGPIINIDSDRKDTVAGPIVDSINTNMSAVIALLNKLVEKDTKKETKNKEYPTLASVPSVNRANSTDVLNYGKQEMGMA